MKSRTAATTALLLLIPALIICMVPSSDAADPPVLDDYVTIRPSLEKVDLNAGEHTNLYLEIKNKTTKDIRIYVYDGGSPTDTIVDFPEGNYVNLGVGTTEVLHVVVNALATANKGTHKLPFDIYLNDPDRDEPVTKTLSDLFIINIRSNSTVDEYLALDDDISVSPSIVNANVDSGDTLTVYLDIKNKSNKDLRVYVYEGRTIPHITITFPDGHDVTLEENEIKRVIVEITVDRYANTGDYDVSFAISLNDPDRGSPIPAAASNLVTISVHSTTAGTGMYNKFLGVWENNLPSVLGDSTIPAVLSFVFIICLGHLVCFEILPWVKKVFRRREGI